MIVVLFFFFIFFIHLLSFKKRKDKRPRYLFIILLYLLVGFFFITVILYVYRIGRPMQENILVFQNIYQYQDTSPLDASYSSYTFRVSSFFAVFLTAFAYLLFKLLLFHFEIEFADRAGIIEEYTEAKAEEMADKIGNNLYGSIMSIGLVLAICIFLDRSIVLAFLFYFILRIVLVLSNSKTVSRYFENHVGSTILALFVITAILISILTIPFSVSSKKRDPLFSQEHLDSVSYYVGMKLGYQLDKFGIDYYWANLDATSIREGLEGYLSARNYRKKITPPAYRVESMKMLIDKLKKAKAAHPAISRDIGASYGRQLLLAGVYPNIRSDLTLKGMYDVFSNKTAFLFPPERLNSLITRNVDRYQSHIADHQAHIARTFLLDNAHKDGVVYQPSGLQYIVLKEGNVEHVLPTSTVMAIYKRYTLAGDIIEETPTLQELNLAQVYPGLREIIQQIGVGGKAKAWLPYHLAPDDRSSAVLPGELTVLEVLVEALH